MCRDAQRSTNVTCDIVRGQSELQSREERDDSLPIPSGLPSLEMSAASPPELPPGCRVPSLGFVVTPQSGEEHSKASIV